MKPSASVCNDKLFHQCLPLVTWHSEAVQSRDGQPSMYLLFHCIPREQARSDGGYASFGTNGAVDDWHYYIQDYMGNNRMVVNKNGTVEQVTHSIGYIYAADGTKLRTNLFTFI